MFLTFRALHRGLPAQYSSGFLQYAASCREEYLPDWEAGMVILSRLPKGAHLAIAGTWTHTQVPIVHLRRAGGYCDCIGYVSNSI